jgi:hypothetical protein
VKKTIGFDIESVKMPGPILPEEMPYKDFLLMINMFDMCYTGFWSTALLKIQHVASDTNLDETGKSKDSSDEDEEPAGSKYKCLDLRHGYVQKGVTVPWQLVLDLERLWMPNANLVQGVEEFDRKNSTVYDEGTDMSAYPPENPFPITEIVYVKQTGHESENMSCVDQTTGGAYVSKVKTEISPLLSLMFVSGGSYRDKENETQPRYKPFLPCYHAQAKVNQRASNHTVYVSLPNQLRRLSKTRFSTRVIAMHPVIFLQPSMIQLDFCLLFICLWGMEN